MCKISNGYNYILERNLQVARLLGASIELLGASLITGNSSSISSFSSNSELASLQEYHYPTILMYRGVRGRLKGTSGRHETHPGSWACQNCYRMPCRCHCHAAATLLQIRSREWMLPLLLCACRSYAIALPHELQQAQGVANQWLTSG